MVVDYLATSLQRSVSVYDFLQPEHNDIEQLSCYWSSQQGVIRCDLPFGYDQASSWALGLSVQSC